MSPYTWSTIGGQLPNGLSLSSSTGMITGKPITAGSFSFNAQVKDSRAATASAGLSINISASTALTINTVSPNTGSTSGGGTVKILGTNFQGAMVKFGASSAMSTQFISASEVDAVTPAESAGVVDVIIQNPDGQVATAASGFEFVVPGTGGPILPALPQASVDTTYPSTTGYTVTNVSTGQLQTAINNASCNPNGTILQLPKGDVESGSFKLPLKACAAGQWIIITTAGVALPPQGTRLDPSQYVGQLARLTAPVAETVIATAPNAPVSNYWLTGIEVEQAAVAGSNEAINIGSASATPSQLPTNIIIDRCYIHGKASNSTVLRLVDLNGNNVAVVDSYLSEAHVVGQDTQAIASFSGGPMLIQNNFLEAASENVLLGGAAIGTDQPPYNLFSHDVTIQKNYFFKPLAWRVGDPSYLNIHYGVKNLYEMKQGIRVLVQDNVLEHNWSDGQVGDAVLFTPRMQSGPNAVIQDVTFRYNLVRHSAGGFEISGLDTGETPPDTMHRTDRILIQNSVFDDLGRIPWGGGGGSGYFGLLGAGANAVTFDHNTVSTLDYETFIVNDDIPETNFFFINNIAARAQYGIIAANTSEGNSSINGWLSGPPAGSVSTDVLAGANCATYPSSFQCPSSMTAVGFANYSGGNGGDYRLCTGSAAPAVGCASASPYAAGQPKACQNNTDCGADIGGLKSATTGVAVFPANAPTITSLSATSMVCNGANVLTVNGTNFNLPGTEVLVNGAPVIPKTITATAITIVAPALTGVTVPLTVDNFGLPVTVRLTCQ